MRSTKRIYRSRTPQNLPTVVAQQLTQRLFRDLDAQEITLSRIKLALLCEVAVNVALLKLAHA